MAPLNTQAVSGLQIRASRLPQINMPLPVTYGHIIYYILIISSIVASSMLFLPNIHKMTRNINSAWFRGLMPIKCVPRDPSGCLLLLAAAPL